MRGGDQREIPIAKQPQIDDRLRGAEFRGE